VNFSIHPEEVGYSLLVLELSDWGTPNCCPLVPWPNEVLGNGLLIHATGRGHFWVPQRPSDSPTFSCFQLPTSPTSESPAGWLHSPSLWTKLYHSSLTQSTSSFSIFGAKVLRCAALEGPHIHVGGRSGNQRPSCFVKSQLNGFPRKD
jgi:hypothetical protein